MLLATIFKFWPFFFSLTRWEFSKYIEQIGQGTYSTVFRARDLESGKIVALKKVRFDNFEPESVRFMAREITILRRLDHPNIIKLQGLITSRSSCNMYLVFEYMEHDISGLLSSPEITFTEAQVWISLPNLHASSLSLSTLIERLITGEMLHETTVIWARALPFSRSDA